MSLIRLTRFLPFSRPPRSLFRSADDGLTRRSLEGAALDTGFLGSAFFAGARYPPRMFGEGLNKNKCVIKSEKRHLKSKTKDGVKRDSNFKIFSCIEYVTNTKSFVMLRLTLLLAVWFGFFV